MGNVRVAFIVKSATRTHEYTMTILQNKGDTTFIVRQIFQAY